MHATRKRSKRPPGWEPAPEPLRRVERLLYAAGVKRADLSWHKDGAHPYLSVRLRHPQVPYIPEGDFVSMRVYESQAPGQYFYCMPSFGATLGRWSAWVTETHAALSFMAATLLVGG